MNSGRLGPLGGVRAIRYKGELVAIVASRRVYLTPAVSKLPRGHPKLRFVAALCLYGRDVDAGQVPGPYDDADAELYARTLLIPDEELERFVDEPDEQLAVRLKMPIEQVAARRRDARGDMAGSEHLTA